MNCAKTAEPIEMPSQVGPRNHVLDGGYTLAHLGNMTEAFMCGGDVAFLSNYFDYKPGEAAVYSRVGFTYFSRNSDARV